MIFLGDKKYGPWTDWTPCSETCIDDPENMPFQTRTRVCQPDCAVGFNERRPCVLPICIPSKRWKKGSIQTQGCHKLPFHPIPFFHLGCPNYMASDFLRDETNPLRANVTFQMEVGKVPFGKLIRQEITFHDITGKNGTVDDEDKSSPSLEMSWDIPSWKKPSQSLEVKHFAFLLLNRTYAPTIRIISEVRIRMRLNKYTIAVAAWTVV